MNFKEQLRETKHRHGHEKGHRKGHGKGEGEGKDEGCTRCPLCGAAKAIGMVTGAVTLVIGTEECTYYTKASQTMKGNGAQCFSVVLDQHDITFGSAEKVEEAVHELMEECKPTALFLVTTCVVEIIGDDFTALAKEASAQYNIPVHVIQTNHFKGQDQQDGHEAIRKVVESDPSLTIDRGRMERMMAHKRGGHHEFN